MHCSSIPQAHRTIRNDWKWDDIYKFNLFLESRLKNYFDLRMIPIMHYRNLSYLVINRSEELNPKNIYSIYYEFGKGYNSYKCHQQLPSGLCSSHKYSCKMSKKAEIQNNKMFFPHRGLVCWWLSPNSKLVIEQCALVLFSLLWWKRNLSIGYYPQSISFRINNQQTCKWGLKNQWFCMT